MPPLVNTNKKRKKTNILSETLINDFTLHDVTEADVDGAISALFSQSTSSTLTLTLISLAMELSLVLSQISMLKKTLVEQFFMKSLLMMARKTNTPILKLCLRTSVLLKLDARLVNLESPPNFHPAHPIRTPLSQIPRPQSNLPNVKQFP